MSDQYPLVPNDESNKLKKEPIPDVIPVADWLDDVGYIGGLLYILSRR